MERPYLFPWMARNSRNKANDPEDNTKSIFSVRARKLPPLPDIPGCSLLRPGDPSYSDRLKVYNARTQMSPAVFAVCSTPAAVAAVVTWVKNNGLAFAVRSGGHSYEGFSNSREVVIDVGGLSAVTFDKSNLTVTVGSGATIGDIQDSLKGKRVAFFAGSCPTVGIAGHAMGGGYRFLSRAYGLTSDNLRSLTLISGAGATITADADLPDWPVAYWGQNLERLKKVKSAFDPDNLFHFSQSIPL